jgi:2-haloacid dehalogenase
MAGTPLSGIRACVFDAYGTLFDVNAAAMRCRDVLGAKAEPLAVLWRLRQVEYSWLRSLMGRHADFWRVTGEALDFAMETHGFSDGALRARLMDCYRRLDAYPDAAPLLSSLKAAGFQTAILSNGSPAMLADAVASAGLGASLDAVLSIEDAGIYKPHRSVYQLAVDRLGVPAERICFLSSNGWDAHGAASFGFRVVWVNRARLADERLPGELAGMVASLGELPALLELGA